MEAIRNGCAVAVCLVFGLCGAERPVAHWQFDEGSGTVAVDSSGNGNQGGLFNGAGWTAGRSGTALSLDGANDYFLAPDSAMLRSHEFTLSLWFRADRTQGVQMLLSKPVGSGSDNSYALYIHNGTLNFHTSSYSGAMNVGGITAGVWRHVALKKSGVTARLYLDGALVRSATALANVSYGPRPVLVGAEDDNGDGVPEYFFDGAVDDVRIYDRVVSLSELQGAPPPPSGGDTTSPTVSVSAPVNGSAVSGMVAITAAAADNVGVTAVQLLLDGAHLGPAILSAPYSLSWDSRGASNGTHTLTAVARDAAGNSGLSASVTITVNNAAPQPTGPISHWGLDEGAGTLAIDSSGQGHHAFLRNGAVWSQGQANGALRFSGTAHATVAASPALQVNNFTITMWFLVDSTAGVQALLSRPTGRSTDNVIAVLLQNGAVLFHSSNGSAVMRSPVIAVGQWRRLAITKFGSAVRMYLDGVEVASAHNAPVNLPISDRLILLGAEDDNGDDAGEYHFRGMLDDVRIYNRVLTAAELSQIWAADRRAPELQGISVTRSGSTARISWSTNELADAQVEYGSNTAYGSWSEMPSTRQFAHTVTLSDLNPASDYFYRVHSRDAAGNAVVSEGRSMAALPPQPVFHHILSTGQSLSVGYAGSPALTTTQPFGNLTLSGMSLVPLVESGVETMSTALANTMSSSTGGQFRSIVTRHGVNSLPYSQLKRGTAPYNHGLLQVSRVGAAAAAIPAISSVRGVTVLHGETDQSQGVTASAYAAMLVEWQRDYETDINAMSGRTGVLPLFTDQVSSWASPHFHRRPPEVPLGQLAAAEGNPGRIYLVGPKYQYVYPDTVHPNNHSYRRIGEQFGKVMKKVLVEGQNWTPLRPRSVTRSGNVITAVFHVPAPPLQLDTTLVLGQSNFGFAYADSTNSASIVSVAIMAADTVRITLDRVPTGTNQRLRYALDGTSGSGAQVASAPRGNLRDSDATLSIFDSTNLYNWCVHFEKPIQVQ